jgi:hypothetical protein
MQHGSRSYAQRAVAVEAVSARRKTSPVQAYGAEQIQVRILGSSAAGVSTWQPLLYTVSPPLSPASPHPFPRSSPVSQGHSHGGKVHFEALQLTPLPHSRPSPLPLC